MVVTFTNPPTACQDDLALMRRIQKDDQEAFARLIDRYWGRIFARFMRQLGDRQEAEDLAQDVFLRVYRHRKRYRPEARFTTWLYHIARNVARNAIRARRRKPMKLLTITASSEGGEAWKSLRDHSEIPWQPLERAELAGAVRHAVEGLNGRQRAAVEMQCQDRSYREIAAALSVSPEAAKSLLYRARHELRNSLERLSEQFG